MKKITLVADENIPALESIVDTFANVVRLPGRSISQSDLQDADALIVRSITTVNAALLKNTGVKFVGTCTIGTDHVDVDYLQQESIQFTSAPGCNADAVVDYVISCLFDRYGTLSNIQQKKIGVLGYGQVGSRLVAALSKLSITVIARDPFVDTKYSGASLNDIVSCDAITIHTPLTNAKQSTHPTHHLFNAQLLARLKPDALLINAARGKVIDNEALMALLSSRQHQGFTCVLDVYDEEPSPKPALLTQLQVATSHIAGYSVQGKLRGTTMVTEKLFEHFGWPVSENNLLPDTVLSVNAAHIHSIEQLVQCAYDIQADSQAFQKHYSQASNAALNTFDEDKAAQLFDAYRKNYAQRNEWGFTQLQQLPASLHTMAKQLGFIVL